MNQAPNQLPSRHSPYEPFPWIFWVRIAQLVLTVLVIILSAYAMSQSIFGLGLYFSFFTIGWSVIWVPVVTWGIPRISGRYRPNIIVLVFECLSWLWWLIAFATLAVIAATQDLFTGFTSYTGYKRDYLSDVLSSYGSSSYSPSTDTSSYTSGSSSSSYGGSSDSVSSGLGNVKGALGATKAATAFAAINWALFVTSFIAICVRIHRQRRQRIHDIYQANGNNNGNTNGHGAPVETDKQAQATTQSF